MTKTPITQHHPRDVSAGNSLEEVILINNGPIGRRGLGVVALDDPAEMDAHFKGRNFEKPERLLKSCTAILPLYLVG